jgi:hypothetical protein
MIQALLQSSWHRPAFKSIKINKSDTNKLRKERSQRREQEFFEFQHHNYQATTLPHNKIEGEHTTTEDNEKIDSKKIHTHTILKKLTRH